MDEEGEDDGCAEEQADTEPAGSGNEALGTADVGELLVDAALVAGADEEAEEVGGSRGVGEQEDAGGYEVGGEGGA